jgi:hypothetical protein
VEDALKILAAALKAAAEPELDKVEVQRLQIIAKSLSNLFYGLVFLNMSNRASSLLRQIYHLCNNMLSFQVITVIYGIVTSPSAQT